MKSGSLRLRLVAGGAAAIVLALLVAGAGLAYLFERHVMRALADDLEMELRQVLATIEIDPAGRPLLRREPSDPRFADPLSGLYWQATTEAGGIARSRSLWDVTLPLPDDALVPGEIHHHRISGPGGSELLAIERSVLLRVQGKSVPVRVIIAADLARIAAARRSFTADLAPALGILGLVLAAAMWVQIGLGLQPLQRLRNGIAAIRQGHSPQLVGPAPTEVAPLVEEINGLLATQARDMERSRRRAADLAHGLKTPLAALAADARLLDEKGEHQVAANIEEIGEAMRRHVERELARARIRGAHGPGATLATPLRPLIETLIAMQRRTAEGSRLAFENALEGDPVIAMEKADLAEVLGNLIENAARHARSRVRVGVHSDGRCFIEDDGPGIPEDLRATVLELGNRLDRQGEGAGLGLAIVQEVLEAYGRSLTLETSDLGGLIATF
jgi:signal transduction histidine kinase